MDIHLTTALIRLCILTVVLHSSFKHRDVLGMVIVVIWAAALCTGTLLAWRWATPLFSTPLAFFVAWYIIKNHRRV